MAAGVRRGLAGLLGLLFTCASLAAVTARAGGYEADAGWAPDQPIGSQESWEPDDPCPNVMFVGVRGSGESGPEDIGDPVTDDDLGMGPRVYDLYLETAERVVGRGGSIAAVPVPYPAISVNWAAGTAGIGYAISRSAGETNLSAVLGQVAHECPLARVIVGGYSQGADVIHEAFDGLSSTKVSAIVLVADPTFDPLDSVGAKFGTWEVTAWGFFGPDPMATWIRQRTIAVCNRNDIVCQTWEQLPGWPIPLWNYGSVSIHETYNRGNLWQAAAVAAGWAWNDIPVAPHLSVDRTTGTTTQLFSGTATGFLAGKTARLETFFPGQSSPAKTSTKQVSTDGSFSFFWNWDPGEPCGTYRIKGTDTVTGDWDDVTFTITGCSTPPPPPVVAPSVSVVPASAPSGTTFSFTGSGFTPSGSVARYWQLPGGSWLNSTGTASSSGVYVQSLPTSGSAAAGDGSYFAIDMTTGLSSNIVPFKLTDQADPPLQADPIVWVEPESGPRDTVFSVSGSGFTPAGDVLEKVVHESGDVALYSPRSATSAGAVSFSWSWEEGDPDGWYTAKVKDETTGVTATASLFVEAPVLPPPSAVSVTPSSGAQGTTFAFTATGLAPGEAVTREWRNLTDGSQRGSGLCAACVDEMGRMTYDFGSSLTHNPGLLEFSFRGQESGWTGSAQITLIRNANPSGTVYVVTLEDGFRGPAFPGGGENVFVCGDGWPGNTVYTTALAPPGPETCPGDDPVPGDGLCPGNGRSNSTGSWCVGWGNFPYATDVGQWDGDVRLWPSSATWLGGNPAPQDVILREFRFFITSPGALGLDIAMSVSDATPAVGDEVAFSITIHAEGFGQPAELTNLELVSILPEGLVYRRHEAPQGGTFDPGTDMWHFDRIGHNTTRTVTLVAEVAESGTLHSYVEAVSADQTVWTAKLGNGSIDERDDATATVTVPPTADLSLSLWADAADPLEGAQVLHELTVYNGGPDTAAGVQVSVALPSHLTYLADDSGGAYVPVTGSWNVGSIPTGGSSRIQITTQAVAVGQVTTTAEVAASGLTDPDSTPGNGAPLEDDLAMASVLVRETIAPVVAVPANMTAEAAGPSGAEVDFAATATDANPLNPRVVCSPLAGTVFPLGATTVSCFATDDFGNTGTASFTVTVRDTTPPTLTLPSNMTVEATGPSGRVVSFTATASDLVAPLSPSVACVPSSGSTFPLGATTVNCSASDSAGNSRSGSFTITIRDTTAPTVGSHADVTIEATGPSGAVVTFTNPTASDLVAPLTPTVSCVPASGTTFALGATTVTCSATDTAGNTGTSSFTVTVRDTTAPGLTLPSNMTVEATGPAGRVVNYSSSATDLVAPLSPTVACSPPSGSTFPLGTTTVTCSATDTAGNTRLGSFTVTVRDTTPPTVTAHSDVTAEATGPAGAVVSFTVPTASDLVDGAVAVVCVPPSGSTFPLGATTVTCSATDRAGNTGTGSFTVTVSAGSPDGFGKLAPADEATGLPLSLILSWAASTGAVSYEYCYDTSNDDACDYAWIPAGSSTSAGIGPLDFDATFYWQVRAINGSGTTEADGGSWWQFSISGPALVEMSFRSVGDHDGWVLEQDETSGKGGTFDGTATRARLGDDASDRQYRAILEFDTSLLPDNAVITGVTLRIKKQSITGTNPFTTHGFLTVDMRTGFFHDIQLLEKYDFQAAGSRGNVGRFVKTPVDRWHRAPLRAAAYPLINLIGTTQFRLRFETDDNDDMGADYLSFYTGDAAEADRPQLIVTYYVP